VAGCEFIRSTAGIHDIKSISAALSEKRLTDLARAEHHRWWAERSFNVTVYGSERSSALRTRSDLLDAIVGNSDDAIDRADSLPPSAPPGRPLRRWPGDCHRWIANAPSIQTENLPSVPTSAGPMAALILRLMVAAVYLEYGHGPHRLEKTPPERVTNPLFTWALDAIV
jgi:hypothetical protein